MGSENPMSERRRFVSSEAAVQWLFQMKKHYWICDQYCKIHQPGFKDQVKLRLFRFKAWLAVRKAEEEFKWAKESEARKA